MNVQLRTLACLLFTLLFQFDLLAADEPVRGDIPPEGAWVKYKLSVQDLQNEPVFGNVEFEFVLKVLGEEIRDGEKCRWFEVEIKPTLVNGNNGFASDLLALDRLILKCLFTESGIQRSDREARVVEVVTRINDGAPRQGDAAAVSNNQKKFFGVIMQSVGLLDDLLIQADSLPESLAPRVIAFDSLQRADRNDEMENFWAPLPAAALAIKTREAREIVTPKGNRNGHFVELTVWGHVHSEWKPTLELVPEIPFGIQAIKFTYRFPQVLFDPNSAIIDLARFELKAIDFGDGATSAVPNFP